MKHGRSPGLLGAIDIGAGSGAKIGLFGAAGTSGSAQAALTGAEQELLEEALLPVGDYGSRPDAFADRLVGILSELLARRGASAGALGAVGIACPGLFRSDGSAVVVGNVPFLANANLPRLLHERLHVPARISNDADVGALAEWSLARTELLYWVFGGGWGGAWVSDDGRVLHPSVDWDGDDGSLHFTNEPGYAVPLEKASLRELFMAEGASFERFEALCIEELRPDGGALDDNETNRDTQDRQDNNAPSCESCASLLSAVTGPSGRADCVRAELVLSGPGRWRIFRVFAEADRTFEARLTTEELRGLDDPASAGAVISRLGELGADAAARTDRLFGRVLGEAASIVVEQAERDRVASGSFNEVTRRDGCRAGVPIYVAGGPSRALGLFGPAAREAMRRKGIRSELELSRLEREGRNANLVGAAVLAARCLEDRLARQR